MAETLQTPDGTVLTDVPPVADPAVGDDAAQRAFQQAMAAPEPGEPTMPAPPAKDPEAPYGRRADGSPKRGPGGRPPKAKVDKAEKPRMQAKPAARDFTEDLTGLVQVGWGVLAAASPADAAALSIHGPGMVQAWNALAQENAQVARGIAWLTTGSAYGAVVMATAPLILQVLANHKRLDHKRMGGLGLHDPAELAEYTAQQLAAMTAPMAA